MTSLIALLPAYDATVPFLRDAEEEEEEEEEDEEEEEETEEELAGDDGLVQSARMLKPESAISLIGWANA